MRSSARSTAPSAWSRWAWRASACSAETAAGWSPGSVVSSSSSERSSRISSAMSGLLVGGRRWRLLSTLELLLGLGQDALLFLEVQLRVVVSAEVGVDHPLVAHHGVRRPLGDDPALRHHDHPVGDVADH